MNVRAQRGSGGPYIYEAQARAWRERAKQSAKERAAFDRVAGPSGSFITLIPFHSSS